MWLEQVRKGKNPDHNWDYIIIKRLCCILYSASIEAPWRILEEMKWEILSITFINLGPLMVYDQRRQWHPTPVLLPGKSHGQRSLVGCSPWGCEESDTTEWLHFDFLLSRTGEGNGNPLQCSCLENPRDGGAWWPAVLWGRTESDMTEVT